MNKSINPHAQSQRDQVASDSAQKQQRYWKKNTTNVQKSTSTRTVPKKTKSFVRDVITRPKV
jgi:hypothetical protein